MIVPPYLYPLLYYSRYFPVDYGKQIVDRLITSHMDKQGHVEFRGKFGIQYSLDLGDHVMRQIYLRSVYEWNTIRHIVKMFEQEQIRADGIFLDIGANVGAYSLVLSKFMSGGTVYAYEPNPAARTILSCNIQLNNVTNVKIFDKAVSDSRKEIKLYTQSMATASFYSLPAYQQNKAIYEVVETVPLDEHLSNEEVKSVSVIKIDVEGHELHVLEGAKRIMESDMPLVLIMEINEFSDVISSRNELFEHVCSLGFAGYLPRGFPLGMEKVDKVPENYMDNIIFVRQGA